MTKYRAAVIGCSRMGAFIDNEVTPDMRPFSHAAGYEACERTDLVACSDLRIDIMGQVGTRYGIPVEKQYADYRELLDREEPDIVSVATQPEHRAEIVIAAGSVMNEPRIGPRVRMVSHQAASIPPNRLATFHISSSAAFSMGRVAARIMMTPTNMGSV